MATRIRRSAKSSAKRRMYIRLKEWCGDGETLKIELDNYKNRLADARMSDGNLDDLYILKCSQTLLYTFCSSYYTI
jgi:hypothetical protein